MSTEVVTGAARSSATGAAALVRDPFGSTRTAWHTASSAAAMLAPQSEPLSPLMSGRSLACVFTVIDVPLAPLKAAADAAGVTLNVVFIAAVADAVGAYHRAHGTELPGFRVNMPISQRRPGDEAIGNLMASVSVLMVLMVATLVLSFNSFRMAALIGSVAALSAAW